jgi:putative Ca2+/H+ antiporter (TMEM165/GDT1 family)
MLRAMDWKLFASTFAAIFLAEVGDKTQLATLSLAAGRSSRWTVFAGSALALVTTSAIAVLAGDALARAVPAHWLRRGAGVLFLVLGFVLLVGRDA